TLEQAYERLPEVLADLLERAVEEIGRGLVDLTDCGPEVVPGLDEIVALALEELQSLALLSVLLHREHVHGPDALERVDDLGQLPLQHLRVAVDAGRLVQ